MMLPGYRTPLHDDVIQLAKVFMQKFFDAAKHDRVQALIKEAKQYAAKRKEVCQVLSKHMQLAK